MHIRDDKFPISCAARSGSTMLGALIGSHTQALRKHAASTREGSVPAFGAYAKKLKTSTQYKKRLEVTWPKK